MPDCPALIGVRQVMSQDGLVTGITGGVFDLGEGLRRQQRARAGVVPVADCLVERDRGFPAVTGSGPNAAHEPSTGNSNTTGTSANRRHHPVRVGWFITMTVTAPSRESPRSRFLIARLRRTPREQ
jgi:hypothetical protein